MKAVWNGQVIADSDDTVVIEGNHYFPPDSVQWDNLKENTNETVCPWKGSCNYYNVEVEGQSNESAAFTYKTPRDSANEIVGKDFSNYVAFWHGVTVGAQDMLKVTKYGHSCVLVETEERVALFDPGVWSDLDVDSLERVDRILITHIHADHYKPELVKAVVAKFPEAKIVAHESIQKQMKEDGIEATMKDGTKCSCYFEAEHEAIPVPGAGVPHNNGFHFQDVFTTPGDSHSFSETKKVLALPIIAPWGSTTEAVNLALELKPEYVLPIHDWHYHEKGLTWLYGLLEKSFEGSGIKFLKPVNGEVIEIE